MDDMDDSHPPLEVIVEWIPAIVKGRYLGLSSWIMFIWDHGEPTNPMFSGEFPLMFRSVYIAILFDQEVSATNLDK